MKTRTLILSTAVLLLAAAFRFWRLAELPPGLHSDEAFHLLNAQLIASGRDFPVFFTGNNGNEPLFAYLDTIPVLILGPITWAGRLTAVWAGLLGVAATIRLGNEMFPRQRAGRPAGAALATLFWHVIFSRLGLQGIIAPAAAAATLAALWHGAHTGRWRAFALAGVALGLGLAAYVAFRLFVLVALAAGLALLLARRERRRRLLAGGAVAAASALLVVSPLALFFLRYPEWFFLRYSETSLLSTANPAQALWDSGLKTLAGLVWRGDTNWRQNLPGRPALDAIQAFFAALGAVALVRRWRTPEAFTLAAWLVIGLAPSVITYSAPHFGRTTMVMPALALLVGLGLSGAWQWARRSGWRRALIVAASLISVALTAFAYFGQWAQSSGLWGAFEVEEVDIGRALLTAPPGARLIVPDAPRDPFTVEYIVGAPTFGGIDTYYAVNCLVLPTPATQPAT
ncbi:MAG: glycosyltransferase family 39 protein, partial [Anaerolineales bacterium]